MLESMRAHLTGWPVKIMLGLLIAAFAVWGIGDVFRSGARRRHGGDGRLAVESRVPRCGARSRRTTASCSSGGASLDRRQALQLGLMQQSLQGLVAERLVTAHAQELELTIPDAMLAERIREDPQLPGQPAASTASGWRWWPARSA